VKLPYQNLHVFEDLLPPKISRPYASIAPTLLIHTATLLVLLMVQSWKIKRWAVCIGRMFILSFMKNSSVVSKVIWVEGQIEGL